MICFVIFFFGKTAITIWMTDNEHWKGNVSTESNGLKTIKLLFNLDLVLGSLKTEMVVMYIDLGRLTNSRHI